MINYIKKKLPKLIDFIKHQLSIQKILEYYLVLNDYNTKGSKIWYTEKSALTELLLFCANAPDNFLERELGMKRGVSWGLHFPINFLSWLPN